MADDPKNAAPPAQVDRMIARDQLELVIRRAVELVHVQGDADDRVSESDLIRIGNELGLPPEKVRQALYDMPQLTVEPAWYDRYFDQPIVTASRVLPGQADRTIRRLEEYISAREYMQLVRRRSNELAFIPAEDAISRLARGLSRPGSRYHLAHARRVVVNVQQLETERSHIRIESDFNEQRRTTARDSLIYGGIFGSCIGVVPFAVLADTLSNGVGSFAILGAGLAVSAAGGMGVAVRIAANSFRNKLQQARAEIDGLLDRAEHTDRLEPPPAPWRRSLSARFFGTKS